MPDNPSSQPPPSSAPAMPSSPTGSATSPTSSSAPAASKRYRPAPAKTFQCRGYGECRMVFSRSEHLARHIRKHTGERPFTCHCGKQFSRLDNLRQHAQTVHADKQEHNDRMMRELTSLHATMSAASKGTGRGGRRANNNAAATSASKDEPSLRPGTSTGYEGASDDVEMSNVDDRSPNSSAAPHGSGSHSFRSNSNSSQSFREPIHQSTNQSFRSSATPTSARTPPPHSHSQANPSTATTPSPRAYSHSSHNNQSFLASASAASQHQSGGTHHSSSSQFRFNVADDYERPLSSSGAGWRELERDREFFQQRRPAEGTTSRPTTASGGAGVALPPLSAVIPAGIPPPLSAGSRPTTSTGNFAGFGSSFPPPPGSSSGLPIGAGRPGSSSGLFRFGLPGLGGPGAPPGSSSGYPAAPPSSSGLSGYGGSSHGYGYGNTQIWTGSETRHFPSMLPSAEEPSPNHLPAMDPAMVMDQHQAQQAAPTRENEDSPHSNLANTRKEKLNDREQVEQANMVPSQDPSREEFPSWHSANQNQNVNQAHQEVPYPHQAYYSLPSGQAQEVKNNKSQAAQVDQARQAGQASSSGGRRDSLSATGMNQRGGATMTKMEEAAQHYSAELARQQQEQLRRVKENQSPTAYHPPHTQETHSHNHPHQHPAVPQEAHTQTHQHPHQHPHPPTTHNSAPIHRQSTPRDPAAESMNLDLDLGLLEGIVAPYPIADQTHQPATHHTRTQMHDHLHQPHPMDMDMDTISVYQRQQGQGVQVPVQPQPRPLSRSPLDPQFHRTMGIPMDLGTMVPPPQSQPHRFPPSGHGPLRGGGMHPIHQRQPSQQQQPFIGNMDRGMGMGHINHGSPSAYGGMDMEYMNMGHFGMGDVDGMDGMNRMRSMNTNMDMHGISNMQGGMGPAGGHGHGRGAGTHAQDMNDVSSGMDLPNILKFDGL
ncbi:hypothetical protein D9758_003970 [Tetrapyrgos nigripes]|uniref:C2H2-type domain-containing protein n=1 Tax=Tetrapyrgos nigripes TaxID=182062 RepID=A0A8H5LRU6_9AGAR|nr:hypothetical protein D9758_003970 [Tetrapyrgos nigripes]